MRTANPALSDEVFQKAGRAAESEGAMTIAGTVNKTFLMALIILVTGSYTWNLVLEGEPGAGMGLVILGAIGGLVLALIGIFKPKTSPIVAPLYAVAEGLVLGAISATYQARYAGLPMQAAALTVFTLMALLMAYKSGLIRASDNLRLGLFAATGGIALFYLAAMIGGFFGVQMPLIHSNSTLGILFTLGVVVVAALNLVLDFDFVEQGAAQGAPKYMEWRAALGLTITLVWLYLEILRLLSKLQKR